MHSTPSLNICGRSTLPRQADFVLLDGGADLVPQHTILHGVFLVQCPHREQSEVTSTSFPLLTSLSRILLFTVHFDRNL